MKKILLPLLILILGLGAGGGAAFATIRMIAPPRGGESAAKEEKTSFVPATNLLAPLVTADGRLAGYVSLDFQLEVPATKAEFVAARMPLLLHAINMRTYRTPMAAGPDGMLPDLATFRNLVLAAAPEAFGAGLVRVVAITRAEPV